MFNSYMTLISGSILTIQGIIGIIKARTEQLFKGGF